MARGVKAGARRRRTWEEWYADARDYYCAHGNLLVPGKYETPEGWKLGRWIERQRALYAGRKGVAGVLTETEIRLLERIGMVWRLEYRFAWEDWLRVCADYREAHGDLLVPASYRAGDYHLGNWIRERRKLYWKGELSSAQIRELNALGMAWAVGFQREWDAWYEDARRYRGEHGDLLVPTAYETSEGFALGVWISEQRRIARGGKGSDTLTKEQRRRLDAIGMVWDVREVYAAAWEGMYDLVAAYRAEHGKLPLNAKGVFAADGRRMDTWVRTQRQYLDEGRHSPEREKRLAALGITRPKKRKNAKQRAA